MSIRPPVLITCLALFTTLVVPPAGASTSSEALRIARQGQARWSIGAVRLHDKHGRVRVEAELVADGVVIAHLRLDPRTGAFVRDKVYADHLAAPDPVSLKAAAVRALPRIEVGGWAWPAEHGRAWRVPLRYDGRVIGTVTVDAQRSQLIGHGEREDTEGEDQP